MDGLPRLAGQQPCPRLLLVNGGHGRGMGRLERKYLRMVNRFMLEYVLDHRRGLDHMHRDRRRSILHAVELVDQRLDDRMIDLAR